MKCNVGKTDRILRIILGLVILDWGLYAANPWGMAGFLLLVTGIMSWCPIYFPLKITTDKEPPRHGQKTE